jgi:Tfp pilus assembly protein PilN
MRAVNLLPEGTGQRKSFLKEDPAVVVGSALGAVVLIALAAGFLNVHSKVSANKAQLAAVQTELAKLSEHKRAKPPALAPVNVKPIVPVPSVVSEQQPRLDALATAMSTRIAWDRILREFSLVLPSDVTVTTMSLTAPATPAPGVTAAATQGLTLAGTTYSYDAVARALSRLMLIPDLTNVTLTSSSASPATATSPALVTFNVSAGVKGAPAPPAPPVVTTTSTDTTTTGASS